MKRPYSLRVVLVAAAILWTAGAAAAEFRIGGITVENPWARATTSMAKTGAAFMTIRNGGTEPDRLVAVTSGVAKRAGLHQTLMEGGVMKMRPAGAVEVPAGGVARLEPGGYHVMFTGLAAPLRKGASFPLTLRFEKAGEIEVEVVVMKAGAMGGMKMKRSD